MKTWAFFVLVGLGFCLHPIQEAEKQNLQIAETLLGAENPCMLPEKSPTPQDLSYISGVKIVAVMPQIGNLTSDLHRPKVLWSWFAHYPTYAEFEIPSSEGCPAGKLHLWAEGQPRFSDGVLFYEYGNQTRQAILGMAGPNPVQLELGRPMHLQSMIFEPLRLHLSGAIEAEYRYLKLEYFFECPSTCICKAHSTDGVLTYRKRHSDEKEIWVETGPVEWFWVNPPLQKMTNASQQLEWLFFARRMPASVAFMINGKTVANFTAYEIDYKQGRCKQAELEARPVFYGQNMSLVNLSEMYASQLVDLPAAYLVMEASASIKQEVGKKKAVVLYESLFSDMFAFESTISVREPAPFQDDQNRKAVSIRFGNDSVSPAAYPAAKGKWRVEGFAAVGGLVLLVLFGLVYEIKVLLGKIKM
ncbi:MAG: hypothetical protein QXN37_01735 [Candidatus Anstonellaceae archaeon]